MKRYFIYSLFLIFIIPQLALAASQIVKIEFQGLSSISEKAILARISSQEGTAYSRAVIKRDIKALYQTGWFGNVTVQRQELSGGVKLVFQVTEKKVIGKITIEGNKKIKKPALLEAFHLQEFEQIDQGKLAETKNAIYKLYEEKGYFLVDVDTTIIPFDESKKQVELIVKITENRPVKIRRIKFIGNKDYSDKKLRAVMKTKEKSFLSFMTSSGKLENERLSMDLQLLQYHYLDNGYLKVKVDEPSITLTRDKRSIYITIPVHEGRPYNVSAVDMAGDILTTKEEVVSQLKLEKGQLYKKSFEIEDIKFLEKMYGDQAYAFASIYPHVQTDDSNHTAKVTYFVQKGSKVRIGRIIIKGNDVTRDKVIRREMRVIENSYFSQSDLELSRVRLYQLGFFEDINIATPRGETDDTIDIVVTVKEKSTGTISVGAGFSTLENIIFTATVQKDNFFGLGWRGGLSANISKLRQDIMLSMADQYFLDSKWYFGLTFQKFQSQLNRDFDQNRFGGTATFGREVIDFFHVRLGYMVDDIEVLNFSSQVPQFFQDYASGFTSAVFSSLIYDRRDNRVSTKKGFYTMVRAEYSSDYLGATNNYLQMTNDSRVYFKLPFDFVLKGHSTLGHINSLDGRPVPLFNRYFMGGVNTLRGFELNSIGPEISVPQNANGGDLPFVYGGNKMLMFNAELEIPVVAKAGFYLVGFLDAGDAYGEGENIDLSTLRYDYGFGVRWHSPMGPLRFEWGFPIAKREGESGVVFNFTIGQSF